MATKQKDNHLFEVIDAICTKKPLKNYDKKKASAYIISLWLAQDPELIDIVNEINPYIFKMPDEFIIKYFIKRVPKKKRFIKWTKKEDYPDKIKKQIKKLSQEEEISEREASYSIIGRL